MSTSEVLKKDFPYEGEIFYPSQKKFEETIVFFHHYGGHKKQLKRHIQFVNQLGFQAFAFHLFPQPFQGTFSLLTKPSLYCSTLNSRWKKQMLEILSLLPEKKILFSFSFSCNVIAQILPRMSNIQAVVFDGGPFAQAFQNGWRYLSYQEVVHNPLLRGFILIPWNVFCGFFFLKRKINHAFTKWPLQFPVLSFQAVQDKLVPPDYINNILKKHSHLDLTICPIDHVQHLQGMKLQAELYKDTLRKFLLQHSSSAIIS